MINNRWILTEPRMLLYNQVFIAWERIVSPEKGNRVVPYYLNESSEHWLFATVGTERSRRHMVYVVSEDFVDAYGFARMVSMEKNGEQDGRWKRVTCGIGFRILAASNYQTIKPGQFLKSGAFPLAGVHLKTNWMDQVNLSRNIKVHTSDIEWSGEAWICPKQLKHYPAFCRDKAKIMVCSFVLILAEEEKRYLGYLEDLYEDKMGEKMVQVRWFYHNQEVKQMIPELYAHPDEVFNTAHVQWISAECIDSVAAVLTPNHYEKCLAILRGKSSSGTYMCHRELKCKKIKPFSLSKLRGYDCQELLSLLYYDSKTNVNVQESIEENKDFLSEDPARQCNWRTRNRRKYSKPERFCAAVTKFIPENHIEPPVNKLKIKSTKGTASNEHDGSEASQVSSKFDQENIEFLCQDSGIRGCWFKCKILEISKKDIRVQYIDIHDTDGTGKLEEWIPASRVAIPDKLGMRCAGRPTVRPWPPHNTFDCSFEVGDAVDAWLGDGWWEGVVIGSENSGSDRIEVYFPGESKFVTLQSKDLRPSRDWLHQKWVEIAAKRDILSFISLKRSAKGSNHKLPSLADLQNVEGGLNLEKQLRILNADCLVDKENMQSVAKNASNG